MTREKHTYKYEGPVFTTVYGRSDEICSKSNIVTMAVSLAKAVSNIKWRLHDELGYSCKYIDILVSEIELVLDTEVEYKNESSVFVGDDGCYYRHTDGGFDDLVSDSDLDDEE